MTDEKRKKITVYACAAFLLLLTALMTKDEVTMAGNESSRIGAVQALAERGSFALDNSIFRTVDHIVVDGQCYSDKPLFQMMVGAVMYKAVAVLTGISFKTHYFFSIYITNLLCVGLLNVILFLIFFWRLDRDVEASLASKLFLSASLILSTLLLSYGVSINNHTPSALVSFILAAQLMSYPPKESALRAFLVGVTAGILVNLEIPIGGLFGIGSFLAVWIFSTEKKVVKLFAYSIGGILPMALMGVVNYSVFGQFAPQYIGRGGTFQLGFFYDRTPGYFLDILFCGRGFFSYMPAMLMTLPVLFANRFFRKNGMELLILSTTAAVVLFYGLCTNEYGGWAYGFRYLIQSFRSSGISSPGSTRAKPDPGSMPL